MFVDYLTVMLINVVAGLVIMALFVFRYLDGDRKRMAPGLLASGALSVVTSLHMIFTWPLPGSYNIAFGELALLFGLLFLALGVACLAEWDLLSLAIYAVFAGAAAVVVGLRIFSLKMTSAPLLAAGGFVLTGLATAASLPVYYLRKQPWARALAALALLGSAVIWAVIGYLAYWGHLDSFSKWVPEVMRAKP